MISLDEARNLLALRVEPLGAVELPLEQAVGHVLARPPHADVDAPPGDVSAMDGYAVRAADLAERHRFKVVFEVVAGELGAALPARSAARIFTGAVLPEGADTVVPQEQAVVVGEDEVELDAPARQQHVRSKGEVFRSGQRLAAAGDRVTPPLVGLLAAGGASQVWVVRRPVVAGLVTGSEVVPHDEKPGAGRIRNSNGPMMASLVREARFDPLPVVVVPDREDLLHDAISSALERADVILTSGGVSVGDYDLVPAVVRRLGGDVALHRVAVMPGKPVLVARIGSGWLVGLPGNPVSVLASWRMFARPLIRTLAGHRGEFAETPDQAVLEHDLANVGDRTQLRPAVLTAAGRGGSVVRVLPWKGSHDIVAAARANALARIEAGSSHVRGDSVGCYRL
jgi:molybdopterin molybdotransferase